MSLMSCRHTSSCACVSFCAAVVFASVIFCSTPLVPVLHLFFSTGSRPGAGRAPNGVLQKITDANSAAAQKLTQAQLDVLLQDVEDIFDSETFFKLEEIRTTIRNAYEDADSRCRGRSSTS